MNMVTRERKRDKCGSSPPNPTVLPGVEAVDQVRFIGQVDGRRWGRGQRQRRRRQRHAPGEEIADGPEDVLDQLGGVEDADDVIGEPRRRRLIAPRPGGGQCQLLVALDDILEWRVAILPDFVLDDEIHGGQGGWRHQGQDDVTDPLAADDVIALCHRRHRRFRLGRIGDDFRNDFRRLLVLRRARRG